MTVGERLKLALKGNRDARMILIRDPNRLIQRFVLQNPRITDDEIICARHEPQPRSRSSCARSAITRTGRATIR